MNLNTIRKDYKKLTPSERFFLSVDARSRADENEVKRLLETCPKRTYDLRDLEFEYRMRAIERIAQFFIVQIMSTWLLTGYVESMACLDIQADRAGQDAIDLRRVASMQQYAFAWFCKTIGVTLEQALGQCAVWCYDEVLRDAYALLASASGPLDPGDREDARSWAETWLGAWNNSTDEKKELIEGEPFYEYEDENQTA